MTLLSQTFDTPLGNILAVGDNTALYLLEFLDHLRINDKTKLLEKKTNKAITIGNAKSLDLIQKELSLYFAGKLEKFTVPLALFGTSFQQRVWKELQQIPFGKTWSYATLACRIGNPSACRAVARANGTNRLPIVIPCHRVIQSDGSLGGYNSGLSRKSWMLNHENFFTQYEKDVSQDLYTT